MRLAGRWRPDGAMTLVSAAKEDVPPVVEPRWWRPLGPLGPLRVVVGDGVRLEVPRLLGTLARIAGTGGGCGPGPPGCRSVPGSPRVSRRPLASSTTSTNSPQAR